MWGNWRMGRCLTAATIAGSLLLFALELGRYVHLQTCIYRSYFLGGKNNALQLVCDGTYKKKKKKLVCHGPVLCKVAK